MEQSESVMTIGNTVKDDVLEAGLVDNDDDDDEDDEIDRSLDENDMLDEDDDLDDTLDDEENSTIVHDSSLVDGTDHMTAGTDSMDMDLPSIVQVHSLLEKRNFVCQVIFQL